MQLQVFLGVQIDELFPGLVFEAQLVKAFALVGLGLDGGTGLVFREEVRWRIGGMVRASGDQRLIWITFQKRDRDLVPYPRKGDTAVACPCPAV